MLFPTPADSPDAHDYRRQLLTVPSCAEHNSATSTDDEYLVYTLAMGLTANTLGKNLFLTKVMRAIEKRPALLTALLKSKQYVIVHDTVTGQSSRTIALRVDEARLARTYEKIARALWYNEKGSVWTGSVDTLTEYTLDLDDRPLNDEVQQIARAVDGIFQGVECMGANPEIFAYQIASHEAGHIIRLSFYGETNVTCILKPVAG